MERPKIHNIYKDEGHYVNDEGEVGHNGTVTETTTVTRVYGNKGKSWFSVICVGLAVIGALFWLIMMFVGVWTGNMTWDEIVPANVVIAVCVTFGFFFLLAGFPWGWMIAKRIPFFMAGGFFAMFLLFTVVACLCYALGWINMLVHSANIIRNIRKK